MISDLGALERYSSIDPMTNLDRSSKRGSLRRHPFGSARPLIWHRFAMPLAKSTAPQYLMRQECFAGSAFG